MKLLYKLPIVSGKHRRGVYQCECGKQTTVLIGNVLSGHTRSCGHLRVTSCRAVGKAYTTHRHTKTPTYASWQGMKTRCHNPNSSDYFRYGKAGVEVCLRWRDSFETFLSDMGERPAKHTLDRINPFGNYEPSNCRWADAKLQRANTRENYIRGC